MKRFFVRCRIPGRQWGPVIEARTLKSGLAGAAQVLRDQDALVFCVRLGRDGPMHVVRCGRPPRDPALFRGVDRAEDNRIVLRDGHAFSLLAMRRHGCRTWRAYCRRYPGDSLLTIEEDDRRGFGLLGV